MEAVAQKWGVLDTENNEKEVVSQQQDRHMHIEGSAAFSTSDVRIGVEIHQQHEENRQINNLLENARNKNLLPAPEPPILGSATSSSSHVITQSAPVGIVIQIKDEQQEFYLKEIFNLPPSHGFFCPHCKVCIEKVLVYKRPEEPPETDCRIRCSACFQFLIQIGRQLITSCSWGSGGSGDEGGDTVVPIPPKPPVPIPGQPTEPIPEQPGVIRPGSSRGWEILKSIVYGGLTEILASLSVLTSAASADATTLSIVTLAIANLIGGLFVLVPSLRELKAEKPRAQGEESQTDAPAVDRYSELLGNKNNFILHVFVAILSFLVFGLVPPVVYGFSFYESDDKDFKLGAVAVASLICITLLAIAKAYTQSANNFLTYFKTVLFYITTGALASVLTYVAGALMKRLAEQLGWFEPKSNIGWFPPEMSVEKPGRGSY